MPVPKRPVLVLLLPATLWAENSYVAFAICTLTYLYILLRRVIMRGDAAGHALIVFSDTHVGFGDAVFVRNADFSVHSTQDCITAIMDLITLSLF